MEIEELTKLFVPKVVHSRSSARSSANVIIRSALIVISSLVLVSCGGKWDDDADNWSRAFNGQTRPADVTIVHSRYCRSPHFTYEAYYYFELTASKAFLDAWLKGLVQETPSKDNLGLLLDRPNWFLPKTIESYDMWRIADNTNCYFRIFRDKSTGAIFATDSE
jgi:hypothetical protein